MAHCPNCVSFRIECNVEPEDYDQPCAYFEGYHYDKPEDDPGPDDKTVQVNDLYNRVGLALSMLDTTDFWLQYWYEVANQNVVPDAANELVAMRGHICG